MHALILFLLLALCLPAAAQRRVALTFDDLPVGGMDLPLDDLRSVTTRLLDSLDAAHAPAIGFVNGEKLAGPDHDARLDVLRLWTKRGHPLGNHTWSHPNLDTTPLLTYQSDVIRCEQLLAPLLKEAGQTQLWFRHPFTHTGADLATKEALDSFLKHRGYRIAPFTIEQADWMFAVLYERAVRAKDNDLQQRLRAAYLDFNDAAYRYFETLSKETIGYEVSQIVVLHANRLNADVLPEMLARLAARSYKFVSLEEALRDQAYLRLDTYAGKNGPSWLHRWAISAGKPSRIAEDPDPPAWVLQLYKELSR